MTKTIENVSLVLEGGTFRTVYTAGVLDAFMEENLYFPYIVGVSAGAINTVSYVSKQQKRTLNVLTKYRNDPRYMGLRNYWKERSMVGLDFAYNQIPNKHILFDWETYYAYDGEVEFGVTNARTGEVEYKDALTMTKDCLMLRATCAIPFVFPEIIIDDVPYYDGGLANAIPVDRAIEKGYNKHVLILTRPQGYVKKSGRGTKWSIRLLQKKYPKLVETMRTREARYNERIQDIKELEQAGQVFIFMQDYALKSFENKVEKMQASYNMGYRHAKEKMDALKAFLSEN